MNRYRIKKDPNTNMFYVEKRILLFFWCCPNNYKLAKRTVWGDWVHRFFDTKTHAKKAIQAAENVLAKK